MTKQIYDKNFQAEVPTIVITRRNFEHIGAVKVSDLIYRNNFNSANELSFTAHKSETDDGIWNKINDYNIVYIPEYQEYFEMNVSTNDTGEITKNVTCTSLCESELSQVNLYEIEINTDADMARDDYDKDYPVIFYRDLSSYAKDSVIYKKMYNASLLHRILDKAPNYTVGHVDKSLKNLKTWYQFSISNTTVYDALMGEISEQYHCLFTFNAETRTVNAYDLCNTCKTCGYRGEFTDSCPECKSTHFDGAYGKDTAIYISKDNLCTSAAVSSNKGSLKNCFRISGSDDVITDAVTLLSPGGTNYIYYFSPEAKREMPKNLVTQIDAYMDKYNHSYNRKTFALNNITGYNNAVNFVNTIFKENKFPTIPGTLTGYKNVANYYYETTDLCLFLQSSMFPTVVMEHETIQEEADKLTVENLSPIGVSNVDTVVLSSVDRAVESYCKVYINTALYKISTEASSLSNGSTSGTKKWKGTIRLTELADKENTKAVTLTITIDSELEHFLKQKLEKELAKSVSYSKPVIDIDMPDEDFKDKLKFYHIDYLQSMHQSFEDCLTIINDTASQNQDIGKNFSDTYKKRMAYINNEIAAKNAMLNSVQNIAKQLDDIRQSEKKSLNLETHLGEELWNLFCSYRREDEYQNENYISDGLTNVEIIRKAEELINAAKKELFKAGTMQFDVTADMNNLLALPQFQDFAKDFETGNRIHLMADDTVYPLRLLSYQIDFDDIVSISVEFSTATRTSSGTSDFESIVSSVASLSSAYPSFKQQMIHNANTSATVQGWVRNGLDATNTKLVNDTLTQEIVVDSHGILCRAYDDIEDGYDEHQIKINRNAIYLTNDNWKSIHSAIGKYYYTDPASNKEKLSYGVIADAIVGRLILGETLGIYNEANSMKFDKNGLAISNGKNTISINPNDTDKLFKITNGDKTDVFYTDEHGNLKIAGTITSESGSKIGGWISTDTAIYNGSLTRSNDGDTGLSTADFSRNINGTVLDNLRFAIGKNFGVTNDGTLYCRDADITGTVHATGGSFTGIITAGSGSKIGGWLSTDTAIYNGSLTGNNDGDTGLSTIDFSRDINGTVRNNLRFAIGRNFGVANNGTLYCRDADITGTIHATSGSFRGTILTESGNIGGFSIGKNALYFGAPDLNSTNTSGIYLGSDGFRFNSNIASNYTLIKDGQIYSYGSYGYTYFTDGGITSVNTNDFSGTGYDVIDQYSDTSISMSTLGFDVTNGNFVVFDVDMDGNVSGQTFTCDKFYNSLNQRLLIYSEEKNILFISESTIDYLVLRGKNVTLTSSSGATVTSDERLKNSFKSLDEFDDVFMDLRPIAFKYNNGTSGRFHFGFGANQIKESFLSHGFTTKDFGGFVQMKDHPDNDEYCGYEDPMGLIYTEFTSWNTHMIQKLYKENETLKQRITKLEQAMQKCLNHFNIKED